MGVGFRCGYLNIFIILTKSEVNAIILFVCAEDNFWFWLS